MKYNKIEIYGPSVVDKVQLFDRVLTQSEIDAIDYAERLSWDSDTLLLAEFDENLIAGNIIGMTNPPTLWEIYRKSEAATIYTKIAEVEMGNLLFYDFAAGTQENYTYRIYASNTSERSEPLETSEVLADWYNWSLISPDDDIVYIFNENIESGDIQINDDMTISKNLRRKFPTVTFDEGEYMTGSLNSFVGNINFDGERVYTSGWLDDLRAFINNKSTKILKSPNGDVWKVVTHGFDYKYYDEVFHGDTRTQPAQISFEFVEVSDDFMRYE